ncbi:hypothetical protein [Cupriavidus metallidurans]|uniref:hypothetical protein n=1 Tax=Cupriavidus metallidurans TaxID=119219 RepID=UPI001267F14F|nr:hypothetical protein [Cupriavidus metallidurans]QGS32792.1 hypothetical protein FOB83_28755 [Cupriavidus metallidurans]UBM09539.1 hypothetical protein LAI70_00455 [Cupriavidus metallidurans]
MISDIVYPLFPVPPFQAQTQASATSSTFAIGHIASPAQLVATDVTARRLDITHLEAPINVEVTSDPEVGAHRDIDHLPGND